MPHVTACAMTSCVHCTACACRQAGNPYDFVAHQKLIIGLPFTPAEQHLLKATASQFCALIMQITNQGAGNDSHCHA